MGKKVGSILKVAAPLALNYFLPGLGSAIGSSILGAGTAGASTLGSALVGAGTSALTGGKPLQGAVLGGIGANIGNIGTSESPGSGILGSIGKNVPGVYDLASGANSLTSGIGDVIGNLPSNMQGPTQSGASLGSGSGFLGKAAETLGISGGSPISSAGVLSGSNPVAAGVGGGASSVGGGGMFSDLLNKKNLFPALGALNSYNANAQAQKALTNATGQANAALSPYTGIGSAAAEKLQGYLGLGGTPTSTADILAASPGYKFMLDQGQQGLDRAQAARGGFFSGAALKAAQDYGQGLADQTAQNYYSQLANTMGTGLGAANAMGANTTALGTAKGASDIQTANMINQLLSGYSGKPWWA